MDFAARTVTVAYGPDRRARTIVFDHLLVAAGSQTRFPPGLRPHVHGMKTIHDALVLRNWLIGLLERAEIEEDPARRRALLTIAVAGGGFSGVETIGAINDFLREIARHYPQASAESPTLVLVEPNDRLLPEFEPALGEYTASKLRDAGIDVRLRTKVAAFDGRVLSSMPPAIRRHPCRCAARTMIWTAGVAPSPLIESLALAKGARPHRGRRHHGSSRPRERVGVRRLRRRARASGKPYPTTAQHAMRQGVQAARNIAADRARTACDRSARSATR